MGQTWEGEPNSIKWVTLIKIVALGSRSHTGQNGSHLAKWVCLTFPNLTHLAKCDPFCPVWLLLPSATILISVTHVYRVWLTFPSLTHLAKCDPFCPVWLLLPSATILISVTHFVECDSPSQGWPIWPNVTQIAQCDSYFQVRTFDKCDPFCRVCLTFPNLTHLAKCDPFCPVWLLLPSATILISVTHFIEFGSPSQVWPIWPNVTHFAQCDYYFQVRQFW